MYVFLIQDIQKGRYTLARRSHLIREAKKKEKEEEMKKKEEEETLRRQTKEYEETVKILTDIHNKYKLHTEEFMDSIPEKKQKLKVWISLPP